MQKGVIDHDIMVLNLGSQYGLSMTGVVEAEVVGNGTRRHNTGTFSDITPHSVKRELHEPRFFNQGFKGTSLMTLDVSTAQATILNATEPWLQAVCQPIQIKPKNKR